MRPLAFSNIHAFSVLPLLKYALLIVAWLLLWRLSIFMEYAEHASIWFPPAGLTFTAFLLFGRKAVGPIVIACVLSTFWENSIYHYNRPFMALMGSGAIFAALHACAYGFAAKYVRQAIVEKISSHNLYYIIVRFLVMVAISSFIMSLGGVFLLTDIRALNAFKDTFLAWWIGDMTGVLVLAPMFTGVINRLRPSAGLLSELRYPPKEMHGTTQFYIKLAVSTSYLIVVTLLAQYFQSPEIACFVFFLALPQMWIVHTETAFRAAAGLALLSFTSAGLVAFFGVDTYAYIYQFALNIVACSTYFSMAVPALLSHNKSLIEKAHTDYLTKALSREHFYRLAERCIKHTRRNEERITLLMFDIDNFKGVNDTYGHTIGDEVLIELAEVVQKTLRDSDLFGRFGGDEFIILLPNTPLDNAYKVAEQLRLKINSLSFSSISLPISCSFGLAELTEDAGLQQAFDNADAALLSAKKHGRNMSYSEHLSNLN